MEAGAVYSVGLAGGLRLWNPKNRVVKGTYFDGISVHGFISRAGKNVRHPFFIAKCS